MRLSRVPCIVVTALLGPCNTGHGEETASLREAPRRIAAAEHGVGALVPDAPAVDIAGKKFRLSSFQKSKGLVVAMTSTSCPLCQKYAPTLAKLERQFSSKGVAFVFVNPMSSDSLAEIRSAVRTHRFQGPYVHDSNQELVRKMGARTTTEVFVLDAARTLVYRGAVDDQYGFAYSLETPRHQYLVEALEALLSARQPLVAATSAPGCELWIEKQDQPERDAIPVAYHDRISRIMQFHCIECHRKGGLAPFSLESSEDVVAHAGMIRRVVERDLMPPWFAAKAEGGMPSPWANDRSLAPRDKRDLLAWLAGEHPLGDSSNAPLPRTFPDEWSIGTPDVVLQLPEPIAVKATGRMPYQNVRVETTFDEDKWVQAVEIRPTARAVVHHVLMSIRNATRGGGINERDGFFAAYVPGNTFQRYPEGFAKLLPAGATVHFQLHYTPVGTATEDQTKVGFVFADEPPDHVVRNTGIANHRIAIPPGASNHQEHASLRIRRDVHLLSFLPHMHLRGKAFRYELVLPDKTRSTILDVPRYDFNWQLQYFLAKPMEIPAGSLLELTAWYDNSEENPANPDPTVRVRWGPQTDDEMMLGYVEYYVPGTTPVTTTRSKERSSTAKSSEQSGLARAFRRVDRNGDEKVTATELGKPNLFERLDKNRDGVITLEEAKAVLGIERN